MDRSSAIMIDQPNLFLDYLANVSFVVGGGLAFCLHGTATGTFCNANNEGFHFSIRPPFQITVMKGEESVKIDLSQPPFRIEIT